jgi:hypothetical protein
MAKRRLTDELGAAVDAIFRATQEIKAAGAGATWRKAQVQKYTNLTLAYDKALKDAQNHLASYKRGWSKFKGKVSPALASGRNDFEMFVNLSLAAGRDFKQLVGELQKVAI